MDPLSRLLALLFQLEGDLHHALVVLDRVKCLISDGMFVDLCQDVWISRLPLSCWPTFVNMDMDSHRQVYNLITTNGRVWRISKITYLFGS